MPSQGILLDLAGKGEPREESRQGDGIIGLQMGYVLERSPEVTMRMDRRKSEGISNQAATRLLHQSEQQQWSTPSLK